MKYSLINNEDVIENVLVCDPQNLPEVPSGYRLEVYSGGNIGQSRVNGAWIKPASELAKERAKMVCSRLQGRLVLGEATCTALDAMASDPNTPWAMRQTIQNAIEWRRTSQAMTELGYLLGYTDPQMDDLFRAAMVVDV